MLENTLYVNRHLYDAAEKKSIIENQDELDWFYKKWCDPVKKVNLWDSINDRETFVRNAMLDMRSEWRAKVEGVAPGNPEAGMERIPVEEKVYPAAVPFNKIKEQIEHTKMYQVFQVMPKCSLLHVHSMVALSLEGLAALVADWNAIGKRKIYIAVNPRDLNIKGVMKYGKLDGTNKDELEADGWKDASEVFSDKSEINEMMDLWSFRSPEKTEKIPYMWDGFNRIFFYTEKLFEDRHFFYEYHRRAFVEMIYDNIDYVELRSGFQNFMDDKKDELTEDGSYSPEFLDIIMAAMERAVRDVEKRGRFLYPFENKKKNLTDKLEDIWTKRQNLKVRVILNARRDINPLATWRLEPGQDPEVAKKKREKTMRKLDTAILWKQHKKYQDFVIGFDFVSEEDRGFETYAFYHMLMYAPALYNCVTEDDPKEGANEDEENKSGENKKAENQKGVKYEPYELKIYAPEHTELNHYAAMAEDLRKVRDQICFAAIPRIQLIDFYLHDGESVWTDSGNLVDAVIASHYRIGHGFNIAKFPTLVDHISGKRPLAASDTVSQGLNGPVLEICPISNQMLRYFPDLRNHTAYELMKRGVQCVICNDDPQIFCNSGLAYDFWEAFMGIQLDMRAIKGAVFNAFVCKIISNRTVENYDKVNLSGIGETAGINTNEVAGLISEFNRLYWEPFIETAALILRDDQTK